MLHELSHNVHGPHNDKFHALWDQLRDEHEALMMKGYNGEGFLSEGHRLGGRGSVPMLEARRLARAAAEKRRTLGAGSGQRLGGKAVRPGEDIRRVIVNAVEGRNETLRGCGHNNHSEQEIHDIADAATRNGFRTQAEEDAANETAIAQSLWELVQEDEKAKYGSSYQEVTASNPAGSSGRTQSHPAPSLRRPMQQLPRVPSHDDAATPASSAPASWACEMCTLHNPLNYLCCDACGRERTEVVSKEPTPISPGRKRPVTVDLTGSPPDSQRAAPPAGRPNPKTIAASRTSESLSLGANHKTWTCSFCGRVRDWTFWSCDLCGKIKDSS